LVSANATPTDVILDRFHDIRGTMNPNTARAYFRIISDFASYLDEREILHFSGLTNLEVSRFLSKYNDKPTAFNQALSAIKFILSTCEGSDIEIENLGRIRERVKGKKTSQPDKLFLNRRQLLESRDNAYMLYQRRDIRARNILLFDLAMHTMMRCDELAQVRIGDIDTEEHRIKVRGKGGAGDTAGNRVITAALKLTDQLMIDIERYLVNWRKPCKGETETPSLKKSSKAMCDAPLFTGQKATALTPSAINYVASSMIGSIFETESKTIPRNHAIHCIRRSMASIRLKKGMSITAIQAMLRHNDVRTTMRYISITQDELDEYFLQDTKNTMDEKSQ